MPFDAVVQQQGSSLTKMGGKLFDSPTITRPVFHRNRTVSIGGNFTHAISTAIQAPVSFGTYTVTTANYFFAANQLSMITIGLKGTPRVDRNGCLLWFLSVANDVAARFGKFDKAPQSGAIATGEFYTLQKITGRVFISMGVAYQHSSTPEYACTGTYSLALLDD